MGSWLSVERAYTGIAAQPTFSPAGGTYSSSQSVTISTATSGALIYYTTDGSTPTTGSTLYSGTVTVSSSETLNAIAILPGYQPSTVGSAAYSISGGATFDFYISTTGSDSNPGTLASPWALTAINTHWSTYAGKRVGIIAGTYDCLALNGGSYTVNANDYERAAFEIQGGTSGSPTYIGSCDTSGNYSQLAAILNGNSNYATNNTYGMAIIGHNGISGQSMGYVTIDGLQVLNSTLQAINAGRALGIGLDNLPGIVVKNCYVDTCVFGNQGGDNPAGILLQNLTGGLIQNNYVTGVSYVGFQRASGIQVYWSTGTVMEYNTVVGVDDTMVNGVSYKDTSQSNNTQRYNFVSMPVALGSGTNANPIGTDEDGGYLHVYNNLAIAQGGAVPYVGGSPSPDPPTYTQNWYNNTIVGISAGAWENGVWRSGTAQTLSFYNNVLQRTAGASGSRGDLSMSLTAGNVVDYNLYPSNSPEFSLTTGGGTFPTISHTYTSLSTWQSGIAANNPSCIGQEAHSTTAQDSTFYGGSTAIFVGGSATSPSSYKITAGAPGSASGSHPGSSNGQTSGTAIDMGCWGGTDVNTGLPIAQIGCNFTPP